MDDRQTPLSGTDVHISEKIDPETMSAMTGAFEIWKRLDHGARLTEIASSDCLLPDFSVGTMLHHILQRGYMSLEGSSRQEILSEILMESRTRNGFETTSRLGVIAILKKRQRIDPEARSRDLRPVGSLPCIRAIATLVEQRDGISFDEMLSESRLRRVVDARFEAMWVMRHVCELSLTMIGRNLGGKDHTTVMNGLNRIALRCHDDYGYRISIESLCEAADRTGVERYRSILMRQKDFSARE